MKTEKNNDIDLLITQYLSGKLDKEAFAQLKDWASESEENRIYVKNVRQEVVQVIVQHDV